MINRRRVRQLLGASFRQLRVSLNQSRLRRQISVFFISAGVTLIALTAITYYWMHREQQRLLQQLRAQAARTTLTEQASDTVLLSIPKINLNAAIIDGTSPKALMLAPGHLSHTAEPGHAGNSVIAAHRDTFFHRLPELERGDEILVTRGGHQFHYVVVNKSIVSPSEVSVTFPTKDSRLTLITCYPASYIGPAPKRLIVVAKLQSSPTGFHSL